MTLTSQENIAKISNYRYVIAKLFNYRDLNMGIGGVSFWELLIILIIVMILFGTNRLRNLGTDLGGAIRGFKNAINEGEQEKNETNNKNSERTDNKN